MSRNIGAMLLVAGTCIGSSMVAMPLLLVKIGILPSLLLMFLIWYVMYSTSLVSLELNLQAKQGMSLGQLGRYFSGKKAEFIGDSSVMLLSYSVMSLFLYSVSSILKSLFDWNYSLPYIIGIVSFFSIIIVSLPTKIIDYINRLFFMGLVFSIVLLMLGIVGEISMSDIYSLLLQGTDWDFVTWRSVITGVFVSFGFQVVFHSLTDYCNHDSHALKKVFLLGSAIPAIVSIVWTIGVISIIYAGNADFYHRMLYESVDIGELILVLNDTSRWKIVQILVWAFSLLAAITSILGVGTGLRDAFSKGILANHDIKQSLHKRIIAVFLHKTVTRNKNVSKRLVASSISILPSYIMASYIPNAFFTMLGVAGMILVIIAILQPLYLFRKISTRELYYTEIKRLMIIPISLIVGIVVISCEAMNIFYLVFPH